MTRLPLDRLYSPSHYWLSDHNGTWRVGLTRFGTRLLGEIVDYGFEIQKDAPIAPGQPVGWVEGFKAMSDILAVIGGKFSGGNPQLGTNPEAVDRDCYGEGWLYEAIGMPDALCLDVQGYKALLDSTIDKLAEKQQPSD